LLEAHLSASAASRACRRSLTLRAACPATFLAGLQPLNADLLLNSEGRFFELHGQVVAQVATTLRPRGPPSAATAHIEHLAKQIAEDVSQIALKSLRARKRIPGSPAALKRRMAVTVVRRALLRIAQHLVRLAARLELLLGLRIVRVPVRMVLHRHLAIAGLQLLVARVPRYL